MPVGPEARTPGADSEEKTSSEAFGPVPTVPTVTPGEVAPVEQPGIQHPVIAGHMPVGPEARTPGADSEEKTLSEAFGPVPTVPTVTPGEVAPVEQPGIQHPVIADLSTRA